MKKQSKIPLATAIWANMHSSLVKHGIKFPQNFNGIGAAYAGLCAVDDTLKEYKVKHEF